MKENQNTRNVIIYSFEKYQIKEENKVKRSKGNSYKMHE